MRGRGAKLRPRLWWQVRGDHSPPDSCSLRLKCGGDSQQIGTAAGRNGSLRERFDLSCEGGEIGGRLLI